MKRCVTYLILLLLGTTVLGQNAGDPAMTHDISQAPDHTDAMWVGDHVSPTLIMDLPISAASVLWLASLVLVPGSVVVLAQCWLASRRGGVVSWQPHVLRLASLAIATATLLQISSELHAHFYCLATMEPGAAYVSMYRWSFVRMCNVFSTGLSAAAFCLALAVVAGMLKQKRLEPPTKA